MKIESRYFNDNFRLALPIMLSMAGQSLVQIIDNIMVGRLGAAELAAASLAGTININIIVIGMGITIGLTPLVGQCYSTGRFKEASQLFQNSLIINTAIGVGLTLLALLIFGMLPHFGQPESSLTLGHNYYLWLTASIFPYILFLVVKQFMEGLGNTKVSMYVTLSCNVLNIILNYALIYGHFGAPAMGVEGAGVATFTSRLIMPIAFMICMLRYESYSRYIKMFRPDFSMIRKQVELLKIGTPISIQMILEMLSFTSLTIMMGWISIEAQAASQILISMGSFSFLLTTGFAGAAIINVSHEYGRGDREAVRKYGYAAMAMSVVIMGSASAILLIFGRQIAALFTSDQRVIELTVQMFHVAAIYMIADGLQATALGALRGLTDVFVTMKYALIAYIFTSIPCSYIIGFVLGFGSQGVVVGLLFGFITACTLYIRRFNSQLKLR